MLCLDHEGAIYKYTAGQKEKCLKTHDHNFYPKTLEFHTLTLGVYTGMNSVPNVLKSLYTRGRRYLTFLR